MRKLVAFALLLSGCAHGPRSAPDVVMSENQTADMIEHPDRWNGWTVTMRVYPYDNGFTKSYVACLEACDAAGADQSVLLLHTRAERFKGYRGHRPEIVTGVFGKICPDNMHLCLDAPIRLYAITERE